MLVLLADTNCILIITEFTSTYCSVKSGIEYEMCIEKKHGNKSCLAPWFWSSATTQK